MNINRLHRAIGGLLLPALILSGTVASAQPVLQYSPAISSGLTNPIDIVNAGDASNRLFVVQRGGTIRVYNASLSLTGDFLTVTGIGTAGEGGLLSMAFHPDYETNGYFYVYYTLPDLSLEVARYQVSSTNPDSADAASKQVVLNIPHPNNSNHNGGKLLFGTDGYLYLGTGDGGGAGDVPNNAQNGNSLLGKMLRINVTTTGTAPFYTVPSDNPYLTDAGVLDEIWALGLRNPFRWSFDRSTGDMWIADVGQGAYEEVNYRPADSTAGLNYGWRCYEGNTAYNTAGCQPASSYMSPVFVYDHNGTTGGSSITGGFVYRGTEYPALNGWYICADYVSGNQWTLAPNGAGGWNVFQQNAATFPGNIVAFGEAENGTLYAASLSANTVYKVELSGVLPLTLLSFTGSYRNQTTVLEWSTGYEEALDRFEVEYSTDGQQYHFAGNVAAHNTASAYQFEHYLPANGLLFYRLRMTDRDGSYRYSNIIRVNADASTKNRVVQNIIRDGQLHLQLDGSVRQVNVVAISGETVFGHRLDGQSGLLHLPLDGLAQGMYLVHLYRHDRREVSKIIVQ